MLKIYFPNPEYPRGNIKLKINSAGRVLLQDIF